MAFFDLSQDELERYCPELEEPEDLEQFWTSTLADARRQPLDAVFEEVDNGLDLVRSFDVTFTGFGGTRVRGWLNVPAAAEGPLPAVVEYVGYNGGRGLAHQNVLYALAGYAHFIMDTRGQGGGGLVGHTPDDSPFSGDNAVSGRMTQGVLDPSRHYYRRVFTDAVRAVDAVKEHASVDASRVVVAGISQGGGISIAAAALADGVIGAMPDVPFLCHYRRATTITDSMPYFEVTAYLMRHRDREEQAYRTLSYVDAAVLAPRAKVPALFSVALMDKVCPPSTVYAAFNRWGHQDRRINVYKFNGHEGGQEFQQLEKLEWLRKVFAA